MNSIKRRDFLQASLKAAATLAFSGAAPHISAQDRKASFIPSESPIVLARNDLVRDRNNKLVSEQVQKLLDGALQQLLQVDKTEQAWQRLFKKDDIVGIKINCLAGKGISTHSELVDAIISGLTSAGVSERNIIIWDRANRDLEKAGFQIKTGRNEIKCYGNDQFGYTAEIYEYGSIGSHLSKILVHQCTAVINVPILKDHGIVGMTNALKNFFGAIHNPNKYHDNRGDPYIADVNMLPEIRSKVRLIITDALTAQCEGGPPSMPQWAWNYNGLVIGFDPVAIDMIGWDIIEQKRKEMGLPSLKQAGREPSYITTAGDAQHRLGLSDLKKVKIIRI
ncbi:MAG: DUF362 domain-containing protein [candidate division KSB1 bacterium]|nr:DUF362 domain-containing protein [candidate division KSB1 bacterium]MDZ7334869.1 DUF362 domain-containing protein [candidate division KSB1 bacterium]MDZ7357353.1 DUF362 domain-containing protein [candidate division KSB1 bacterium]MDZ7399324.1 DUF362 domain-containing protein [candidate division KSB1 bacterium]